MISSPGERLAELSRIRRHGVDLDLAIRCVELSRLAYADASEGRQRALQYGYSNYRALARRQGRDHAIVVGDSHHRYVSFRGSDDYRDWFTNLRLWSVPTELGRIHQGYLAVALDFLPELVETLAELPDQPVILTGHSMGGALALLSAVYLAREGFTVGGLYTFGQPRTGNHGFSDYVAQTATHPYVRFVHGADAFATWGYGHSAFLGTPCYFDIRGRLGFGRQIRQLPRMGIQFHRLEHYRYFLRLNQLQLQAISENDDVTQLQD